MNMMRRMRVEMMDNMAFIVRNVVMAAKSTELKSILMHSDCRVDYL